jgi:hypothetical protein
LGCSIVVWITLINFSRKVIKISALLLKEDFAIIVESKGLAA